MSSTLLNAVASNDITSSSASSTSSSSGSSSAGPSFVPNRRAFTHASTFSAGMGPPHSSSSGFAHRPSALRNVRVFDADADLDHVTAQQRSDLQKTARQVRLSVSKGYCTSTPLHTRSSSFASTTAPSSDHPGIDIPSSASSVGSTITDLPFGRSSALPWSRTQSAPVASFMRPGRDVAAAAAYYNDTASPVFSDYRANELQPFCSRPQRLYEPVASTQSAFGRTNTTRSQHRTRFADDEDGDVTAIDIEPLKAGDGAEPDSVLGAHFEADDDGFDEGAFTISREDRQGSSSDEDDGNSTSQSEGEEEEDEQDDMLSASAETALTNASDAQGSPKKKRSAFPPSASSSSRYPLSARPNGLASKTTSLPAGPFDAANRIDESFARRTVLRQGLESRTRTVASGVPPPPARAAAQGKVVENDLPPWTPRDFARWASSSENF
ncbi:hypothetical protein OC835_001210 [Tilletia horrida]|nr:hypothetical protein OC835_001210 [Tilletia horrida]